MTNPCPACRMHWKFCSKFRECEKFRAYLREIWPTAEDVERAQRLRDQELAHKRRRDAQKAYTDMLYHEAVPWKKEEPGVRKAISVSAEDTGC